MRLTEPDDARVARPQGPAVRKPSRARVGRRRPLCHQCRSGRALGAIRLPPGDAMRFHAAKERLIDELANDIHALFESEAYQELDEAAQEARDKVIAQTEEELSDVLKSAPRVRRTTAKRSRNRTTRWRPPGSMRQSVRRGRRFWPRPRCSGIRTRPRRALSGGQPEPARRGPVACLRQAVARRGGG